MNILTLFNAVPGLLCLLLSASIVQAISPPPPRSCTYVEEQGVLYDSDHRYGLVYCPTQPGQIGPRRYSTYWGGAAMQYWSAINGTYVPAAKKGDWAVARCFWNNNIVMEFPIQFCRNDDWAVAPEATPSYGGAITTYWVKSVSFEATFGNGLGAADFYGLDVATLLLPRNPIVSTPEVSIGIKPYMRQRDGKDGRIVDLARYTLDGADRLSTVTLEYLPGNLHHWKGKDVFSIPKVYEFNNKSGNVDCLSVGFAFGEIATTAPNPYWGCSTFLVGQEIPRGPLKLTMEVTGFTSDYVYIDVPVEGNWNIQRALLLAPDPTSPNPGRSLPPLNLPTAVQEKLREHAVVDGVHIIDEEDNLAGPDGVVDAADLVPAPAAP